MSQFFYPIVSALSQVAAVVATAIVFRRLTLEMKIIGAYLVLSLMATILQVILALTGIHNLWTVEWFLPFEFTLIGLAYARTIKSAVVRRVLAVCSIVVVCSTGLNLGGCFAGKDLYPYLESGADSVLVIASCSILLSKVAEKNERPFSQPMFWVASANVVYFSSIVILFSLLSAIFQAPLETMRTAWSVQSIANVVANILYIRAFLCFRHT